MGKIFTRLRPTPVGQSIIASNSDYLTPAVISVGLFFQEVAVEQSIRPLTEILRLERAGDPSVNHWHLRPSNGGYSSL